MAAQVAKVKARARPWRAILALIAALLCLGAAAYGRHAVGIVGRPDAYLDDPTARGLQWGGAIAFFILGTIAAFGLSGQVRNLSQPAIGAAHAGVLRYGLVLLGMFVVLVVALHVASVPVGQLVVGGAVTGVLLGIAAQQSLANLFAGMVLLFARPFQVGDRVRFRAGALSGVLEGTVTDISITYVRLETAEGLVFVPNSQALAATVGPLPPAPPADSNGQQPAAAQPALTPGPPTAPGR
jgi:small-conductance mechanosensitive channel